MTTKICSKCGIQKPISEFYKYKFSKDGHRSICKECAKRVQKDYVKNNLNKVKETQRKNYIT